MLIFREYGEDLFANDNFNYSKLYVPAGTLEDYQFTWPLRSLSSHTTIRFVGDYAPNGVSPQMYNMPVILQTKVTLQLSVTFVFLFKTFRTYSAILPQVYLARHILAQEIP